MNLDEYKFSHGELNASKTNVAPPTDTGKFPTQHSPVETV